MAEDRPNGRVLVIYSFYDSLHARANLRFFLRHVVGAPSAKHVDVFIVDTTPNGPTVPFPFHPQLRYMHRSNEGYDMCSHKVALDRSKPGRYAYVILMNGSVRGPFAKGDLAAPFAALFKEDVAMVGTTVSCIGNPHAQSMFLVLNPVGITLLNRTLHCGHKSKWDAIWGAGGEIDLSRQIMKEGYRISARQPFWRKHDFRDVNLTQERCTSRVNLWGSKERDGCEGHGYLWDPYYTLCDVDPITLRPKDIDPEEVVFFKTNRQVGVGKLNALTKAYDDMCTAGGCGSWNATIPIESGISGVWALWRGYSGDPMTSSCCLRELLYETWYAFVGGVRRSIGSAESLAEI